MTQDVNFTVENNRFNFRVGAYITYNDEMLVQKSSTVDFHNLLGGRVKMGENTYQAIFRELKEELNLDSVKPNLMLVAENNFMWEDKNVNELLFIYHIEVTDEQYKLLPSGMQVPDTEDETIYWVKKQNIQNLVCLPKLIYDLPTMDISKIDHHIN